MKRSLLVLFLLYSMLNATIINVPDDQPTIQEGIDASADGDTVLVQPGTYYENINYNGKNIAVASLFLTTQDTTYISITAIDGNQNGSVVTFNNNESYLASLCGFTITNGSGQIWGSYGYIYGGGIFCHSSSPILKNLIIKNNDILPYPGFGFGAGISIIYSNLIMENILITNNYSEYCGGGISIQGQNYNPICKNVIIANNTAVYGGGIYCYSSPSLENLSIMNNNAAHGGGIQIMYSASPTITNSIISNNSGGGGISIYNSTGTPSISYSDVFNNIGGNYVNCDPSLEEIVTTNANGDSCDIYYNIQLDPLFVNLANGDYQLLDDSPCIDAGNPIPEYNDGCFPPGLGNITNDMGVFGGLWNCGWLEPLNNIPEVSNVVFSQAVDGSRHLNIIYDVYDATNDIMEISVFVSFDSGSSWEECQNVSGDVGAGQVSGMNKQIEWDFGSQFPNIFSNNAIIKVEADNGN